MAVAACLIALRGCLVHCALRGLWVAIAMEVAWVVCAIAGKFACGVACCAREGKEQRGEGGGLLVIHSNPSGWDNPE